MTSKDQKRQQNARKDQADGQGEGRRDPFEATSPQPKNTPTTKTPASPDDDDREDRSNLADIGEAEEQEGEVGGMKKGAARQDPPATLPQEARHERRNNT